MKGSVARRIVPLLVNAVVMSLCLFPAAGDIGWCNGWVLIGLSLFTGLASSAVLARQAGLLAERRDVRRGATWDKLLVGLTVLAGPVATWITAGLDVRHHGYEVIPTSGVLVGVGFALVGAALLVWAMAVNAFFSSVARIQHDRGHTVATGGPYRIVRHPGYAGTLLFLVGTPLILGSRAAWIPAALTAALIVLRTALEDRMLRRELGGYGVYAQTVRFRLVPLIW